jgi:hypothetical protein
MHHPADTNTSESRNPVTRDATVLHGAAGLPQSEQVSIPQLNVDSSSSESVTMFGKVVGKTPPNHSRLTIRPVDL